MNLVRIHFLNPSRIAGSRPWGHLFGRNQFLLRGLLVFAFALAGTLVLHRLPARASAGASQDKKEAELRTVHGVVVDKNENGISSGIVYLENMKTENVRTYITDDSGNYRFSGLDPNEDYQIHAEKGDVISSTRTISSFDSRRDIEIVLKLVHKKKPGSG
jgi:hypothetical protein